MPAEDGVTTMTSLVLSAQGRRVLDRVTVCGRGQFRLGTEGNGFPTAPRSAGTTAPVAAEPAPTPRAGLGLKVGDSDDLSLG